MSDGFMSCPCGRDDYANCADCPYPECSVHGLSNALQVIRDAFWPDGDCDTWVCVTHRRFVPCRHDNAECVLSTNKDDVEMVRKYQNG